MLAHTMRIDLPGVHDCSLSVRVRAATPAWLASATLPQALVFRRCHALRDDFTGESGFRSHRGHGLCDRRSRARKQQRSQQQSKSQQSATRFTWKRGHLDPAVTRRDSSCHSVPYLHSQETLSLATRRSWAWLTRCVGIYHSVGIYHTICANSNTRYYCRQYSVVY